MKNVLIVKTILNSCQLKNYSTNLRNFNDQGSVMNTSLLVSNGEVIAVKQFLHFTLL